MSSNWVGLSHLLGYHAHVWDKEVGGLRINEFMTPFMKINNRRLLVMSSDASISYL